MLTFEKFRFRSFDRRAYYDIFNAGILFLIALMVFLSFFPELRAFQPISEGDRLNTVAMMTSPLLLAAMGMMLAYRYGAVDLSIWAVMGLGGLIAAEMLNAGFGPGLSFLTAILVGVAIGWINFILIRFIRIPSGIITFLVGVGIILLLNWHYDVRRVEITQHTFDELVRKVTWFLNSQPSIKPNDNLELRAPLVTMRMYLVFLGWTAVLVVLLIGDMLTSKMPRPFARWWVRPAALMASGGLCGLAGASWLLEYGSTPVPYRPIDDLYIPAVVILSGTIFLTGRGRTLLVGICLPAAMLIVLLWNQITWPLSFYGYSVEMLTLMVMIGVIQWMFIWAMDYPIDQAWIGWVSLGICIFGLAMLALTPCFAGELSPRVVYFTGTAIWALGAAITGISALIIFRRRSKTDYD